MKTVMLIRKPLIGRLFPEDALRGIADLGQLILFDGEADPTQAEAAALCKDADAIITGWGSPRIEGDILEAAPNLRAVFHAAGSVKPVVSEAMWAQGVRVTNAAQPLGEGVAETTLGLTIACMKNFPNLWRECAQGGWGEGLSEVRELYDVTIGVIGAGCAGSHYIRLLQAFHVDILVSDPQLSEDAAAAMGAKKADLEHILRTADLVSIHAPSIPQTHHMIDARTLALMKKDAILINTARGTLIDEAALLTHLQSGALKYACIDVTDPEPPASEHPLRGQPRLLMTPHIAGLANNGLRRIGRHVQAEMARFAQGQPLLSEVSEQALSNLA